jgi:hypothetical protein
VPKDFKERPARKKAPSRGRRKSAPPPRRWPAFVAGVVVGVAGTVASFVYEPGETLERAVKEVASGGGGDAPRSTRFEFYTVLPEKEIAIPETDLEPVAPAPRDDAAPVTSAAAPAASGERFMLQVGSFRSLEDADRLKAKLAFLGLESTIQTVSLDGRETWHRVHVGPYEGRAALAEARGRLKENRFEAMVLKLK